MKPIAHGLQPVRLLAALILIAACDGPDNICGDGFRPSLEGQRCVPMGSDDHDPRTHEPEEVKDPKPTGSKDAGGKGPADGGAEKPNAGLDASTDADAAGGPDDEDAQTPDTGMPDASEVVGADAQLDAEAPGVQTDSGTVDAHLDAGQPDADAIADGTLEGGEGDAALSDPCPRDDANRWAAMHLSGSLVPSIGMCVDELACTPVDCPLDVCMREVAEVSACDACVADEVACVFGECLDACAPGSTDAACLACACEAGCVTLFEQCSGREVGACDACEPAILYCHGMHPWPALMVPILHPILGG